MYTLCGHHVRFGGYFDAYPMCGHYVKEGATSSPTLTLLYWQGWSTIVSYGGYCVTKKGTSIGTYYAIVTLLYWQEG